MKVIVKANHMDLTPSLKLHAEEKLGNPIMRVFDRPAAKIVIELCDLGHVQDGADKECRATVFMPKGKTVVIREANSDMYKAIDMAHHRLLLQVNRERGRKKKATLNRKLAVRDRALTAQHSLTAEPEVWEREVSEFERASARG